MKPVKIIKDAGHILFPALEQTIIAVVLVDEKNRIVFFNPAAEKLWQFSREEVVGQDMKILLPPSLQYNHKVWIQRHREGAESRVVGMNRELQLERSDGKKVWAVFSLSKVDVNGRIYYMAMARDVSDEVAAREQNRLLLLAVNHTVHPIIVLDIQHHILQVNKAFTTLTGLSVPDIVGKKAMALLPVQKKYKNISDRFTRLLKQNDWFQEDIPVSCADGAVMWFSAQIDPVSDGDGKLRNQVLALTDITREREIREYEKDILAILISSLSMMETGDAICRRIESLIHGCTALLYFYSGEQLLLWGESSSSGGHNGPQGIQGKKRKTWTLRSYNNQLMGKLVLNFSDDTQADLYTARIADISAHLCVLALEQEEKRQQIERLIQTDALTGLPNRSSLNHYIDRLFESTSVSQLSTFSFCIDNFSEINDSMGYAVADQLLLLMVIRLQSVLEPGYFLSRTEGIQFILVVPECDIILSSKIAQDLEKIAEKPVVLGGNTFSITFSIGISHYPECSRDELLSGAKMAMEHVRATGGNRWQFFNHETDRMVRERILMKRALKEAIEGNELRLEYQPQICADDNTVYGFEALARWHSPSYGEVPPYKFITMAEETGDIKALGEWVIREACRQMAEWKLSGVRIHSVSVNLSALNFRCPYLPSVIAGLLKEYHLPGNMLTIEITESAMLEFDSGILKRIQEIRDLDVGLSIDDFGTGYSSLSRLTGLPVTELKIDKSFIDRFQYDEKVAVLVKAITGIGRSMGMSVVAEGVETKDQLELLKKIGTSEIVIQGYYFSRPLPADMVPDWLTLYAENEF
ncbi:sensory box/GGDEF family protein [Trabulsiella guamensis ATCC 49490]|uniref:Sensory box/GGDEF family protein n=1 Tax=Trabulsiella guamensis ATCC 49490 TaxID=1005994 RepID=A0A084ZPD6_9ENTR|nr:oxygen-sensing cyclic-di-GMP phosphodiesterase DosP [Trabulsiella guamensis]KFB99330.1 sensory box/GGDEF family protein [Trabulsiella guamensis ATCC 49490]